MKENGRSICGGKAFVLDLHAIVAGLSGCPCGRRHEVAIRDVRIGRGLVAQAGVILAQNDFPKNILLVADENTLRASDGILPALENAGYRAKLRLYKNLRVAEMENVDAIAAQLADFEAVLSVGSGSLNDVCRLAAKKADVPFAIFATAPSMDGFASCTAPITVNHFKRSYPARQPDVIIADTDILAAAPGELKAAGFGDVIGKFTALADWRLSHLFTGEYLCDRVVSLTRDAAQSVADMADSIQKNDPDAAQKLMEALVITGIAMTFAGCTRPASGAEHIVSHFWEIQKLARGEISDYHGKKVGIATDIVNRIYHELAASEDVSPATKPLDWDGIEAAFGPNFIKQVRRDNTPPLEDALDLARLKALWPQARQIIFEELPDVETLRNWMCAANAPIDPASADVDDELARRGVRWAAYMRDRFTLLRIMPLLSMESAMKP